MESFPPAFLQCPPPLVSVQGEGLSFSSALVACLSQLNTQMPLISFKCFSSAAAMNIPTKRVTKPLQRDTIEYGILKHDWINKTASEIPSVIIHYASFNIAVNIEWDLREYKSIKVLADSHDVKIVVLAIITGADGLDVETVDERINQLQTSISASPRNFVLFSQSDLSVSSTTLRRLYKLVRDLSTAFYNTRIKMIKTKMFDSSSHRSVRDVMVITKYNFKLAFFSEFYGPNSIPLRYYKQCYQCLVDSTNNASVSSEQDMSIIKGVEEMVNYKICFLLFSMGSHYDATLQFKHHIASFFSLNNQRSQLAWLHQQWIARQYLLFAQLARKFRSSLPVPSLDLDPSVYFNMAAQYTLHTDALAVAALKSSSESLESLLETHLAGYGIAQSVYIGAYPYLIHNNLPSKKSFSSDPLMQAILLKYFEGIESTIDRKSNAIQLLGESLHWVDEKHRRKRALIRAQIADIELSKDELQSALSGYIVVVNTLLEERWAAAAVPHLQRLLSCAQRSMRDKEFILFGLKYYALGLSCPGLVSPRELTDMHNSIMSTLLRAHELFGSSNPMASFYGLKNEYEIPLTAAMSLLKVLVTFDRHDVSVGETVLVKVAVTSTFLTTMRFSEIALFFSDDTTIHRLVNTDTSACSLFAIDKTDSHASNTTMAHLDLTLTMNDDVPCPLVFPSNTTVYFSYAFPMTEHLYSLCTDSYRYINKVQVCLPIFSGSTIPSSPMAVRSRRDSGPRSRNESVQGDDAGRPANAKFFDVSTGESTDSLTDLVELSGLSSPGPLERLRSFSGTSSAAPESNASARDVVFVIDRLPPIEQLSAYSKSTLGDLVPVFPLVRASVIRVVKPESHLVLISPSTTVELLQGVVKRIDVIVQANSDAIKDGFLYLESENPVASNLVFWYADPSFSESSTRYFPLRLSTSTSQPSLPFKLPPIDPSSVFSFPLFLRSVLVGNLNIRLKFSYISNVHLSEELVASKSFTIQCVVREPLVAKFSVVSSNPHSRGLSKEAITNSVVRGDTVRLTVALECPFEIKDSVCIRKVRLIANSASTSEGGSEVFAIKDGDGVMLSDSLVPGATPILHAGEVLVGSTHVVCSNVTASPLLSNGLKATESAVLGCVDVLLSTLPSSASSAHTSIEDGDSIISIDLAEHLSSDYVADLLDRSSSITELSSMLFYMPLVAIIDCPFAAELKIPIIIRLKEEFCVRCCVSNRLQSLEQIRFTIDPCESFLINCESNGVIKIPPSQEMTIEFKLFPLVTGFCALPGVRVLWLTEGSSASILEVGGDSTNKFVYVEQTCRSNENSSTKRGVIVAEAYRNVSGLAGGLA